MKTARTVTWEEICSRKEVIDLLLGMGLPKTDSWSHPNNRAIVEETLARSKATVDVLTFLSESKDFQTRCRVASNPNTPQEVLLELAKDKKPKVKVHLILNPNTPQEALVLLSQGQSKLVKTWAQMRLNRIFNP